MATKNNQWTKVISKKSNEVKSKKTYSAQPVLATVPNFKLVANKVILKPVINKVIEYTLVLLSGRQGFWKRRKN